MEGSKKWRRVIDSEKSGRLGGRSSLSALRLPLLGAWSFWREEDDPQARRREILDHASDFYKECVGLAVEADQEMMRATLDEHEKAEKKAEAERKRWERGMSLSEYSKEVNRDLIEGQQEKPRPGPFDEFPKPTNFDRECAPMLRGCFLPAEPVTKVEEFTYRVRHCQPLPRDCDTLRGQVSQLQEQRPPLRESKNKACRDADPKDAECIYRYRRLEVVIDAIALTELAAERACLQ